MKLRTLLIAYPGRYSGVMEPWRHYVPLEKDHSNMAEVAAVVRDADRVSEIVTDAYAEVALNPALAYKAFIARVDAILQEMAADKRPARSGRYGPAAFHKQFHFYMIDNPHEVSPPATGPFARGRRLARRIYGGVRRRVSAGR